MSRIDDIKARLDIVTPEKWERHHIEDGMDAGGDAVGYMDDGEFVVIVPCVYSGFDSDFIAHAPSDMAYLLAENARLQKEADDR